VLLSDRHFSISGTVIEQGQSVEFYQANYPEHPALFGFLTWKVLLTVGWDRIALGGFSLTHPYLAPA